MIFMVVLGHSIAGEPSQNNNIYGISHYLIYCNHMPMFLIISGYLSRNHWTLKKCIKNYVVPYVVFDIAWVVYALLVGNATINDLVILTPTYVYWYILSLFFLRMISSNSLWGYLFLPCSILLTLISPYIDENYWRILSFGRVALLYPIYWIGKKYISTIIDTLRNTNKVVGYILIFACILIELLVLKLGVVDITWASHDYPTYTIETVIKYVFQFLVIIIFIGLTIDVPDKETMLSRWGRNSVIVYLIHPFALSVLLFVLHMVNVEMDALFFFIFVVLSIVITEVLSHDILKKTYDSFMINIYKLLNLLK